METESDNGKEAKINEQWISSESSGDSTESKSNDLNSACDSITLGDNDLVCFDTWMQDQNLKNQVGIKLKVWG